MLSLADTMLPHLEASFKCLLSENQKGKKKAAISCRIGGKKKKCSLTTFLEGKVLSVQGWYLSLNDPGKVMGNRNEMIAV